MCTVFDATYAANEKSKALELGMARLKIHCDQRVFVQLQTHLILQALDHVMFGKFTLEPDLGEDGVSFRALFGVPSPVFESRRMFSKFIFIFE